MYHLLWKLQAIALDTDMAITADTAIEQRLDE